MKLTVVAVNFRTSHLISSWANSIRRCYQHPKLILIDSFSSEDELEAVREVGETLDIHIIESENRGYGSALNKAITFVKTDPNFSADIIMCGNLDLEFSHIPILDPQPKFVYVPKVSDGNKINLNPFLTHFQLKHFKHYKYAAYLNSSLFYFLSVTLNKVLGLVPSPIAAIHGSLFCFTPDLIDDDVMPFNEDSFLYGEELEFASYCQWRDAIFVPSEIQVRHLGHKSTSLVISRHKDFMKYWAPSFFNWLKRWKAIP